MGILIYLNYSESNRAKVRGGGYKEKSVHDCKARFLLRRIKENWGLEKGDRREPEPFWTNYHFVILPSMNVQTRPWGGLNSRGWMMATEFTETKTKKSCQRGGKTCNRIIYDSRIVSNLSLPKNNIRVTNCNQVLISL